MKFIIAGFIVLSFLGAIVAIPVSNGPTTGVFTKTYANSQVDTLRYIRPPGLSALSFAPYWNDSVKITSIIVRRVSNGVTLSVIAGDTLATSLTGTSTTARLYAVTLAPISEEYQVIVSYDTSANGVTTATVNYKFNQQLTAR